MKPTHRSGYRYKIDKTDGNWYRSDDPRMRPLDPRERVAVAAAGDAYAAACRARAHYHEIEQYGTFARSVACLLYTSPSPRDGLLSRMPSSA